MTDVSKAEKYGTSHVLYAKWQEKYGGAQGLGANIVVPKLIYTREMGDTGKRMAPIRTQQVIIAHPDDAARIARLHIRKQPNFNIALFGSVISTVDNEHWKNQRETLVTAFLPKVSLEQVFPVTAARAKYCTKRLADVSEKFTKPVDMNDFFLYETEAQLQLSMFGEENDFMERTNEKFRRAMSGRQSLSYVKDFLQELSGHFGDERNTPPACPGALQGGACPVVHGPLSNRIADLKSDRSTLLGNALIFAFAGHDTTGHTLTWLLFELAKHPQYQKELQREVDAFFEEIGNRAVEYEDLKKLPFMTRCWTETLRLWPAVANGTFREIQFDDQITGPNGQPVPIKKGTYVQIVNWSRHRNPDIWGDDVLQFNPHREFKDSELWHGQVFAAYNPSTERFSPFTFPPRDCIGKNFAHQEARVILANLLHKYSFELSDEFRKNIDPESYLGVNYGTLAPQNVLEPPLVKGYGRFGQRKMSPTGMYFNVLPRGSKL
mmetsp:Transcript_2120/g.4105  ORF Transcript_2120/g.4105 Transcript_2120/m.4105 type:complete len:492 (+) Transcript_2120:1756-3231(+)